MLDLVAKTSENERLSLYPLQRRCGDSLFRIEDERQRLVVCVEDHFAACKKLPKSLKRVDDTQRFLFYLRVVSLGR